MLTLFFNPEPVSNWETASQCDTTAFGNYFWRMIEQGIYLPCSQYEAMFISSAHTEEDIDATIAAAEGALRSE